MPSCRICGRDRANEAFSGRGHRTRVCKTCKKRPKEEIRRIEELQEAAGFIDQSNISKRNVDRLQILSVSADLDVAKLATLVLRVAKLNPRRRGRVGYMLRNDPKLLDELVVAGLIGDDLLSPHYCDSEEDHNAGESRTRAVLP